MVSFLNAGAVDTRASFGAPGVYVLRLTGNDGALTAVDTIQVTVQVAPPPGASTLERRVSAGSDDAEESATGTMSLSSGDLELVNDGNNQKVGIRFGNVTVPRGATISRAYVQFEADEAQSEATSLVIQGEASDNALGYTTAANNISGRPRTGASTSWAPLPWTLVSEVGPNQRTPDLSPLVREITGRANWQSGNALALVITGTGHRTARAYEVKPAGAALLHIEYDTGGPQAPANTSPPTITGTAQEGQTLQAGTGVWTGNPTVYEHQWRLCDGTGSGCGDISGATDPTYVLTASELNKTLRVVVTASNLSGRDSATSNATAVVAAAGASDPVIAAAGDICNASLGCSGTATVIDQINPVRVLTLGDNAYEDGSLAQYMSYYDPNWGRHKAKTSPAPGNHEYYTLGAAGYFDYFGALVPGPYYSFDIGAWHLISLNGEIGAAAGSAQEQWLRDDLAAHTAQCTLAYWHEPRFSSGAGHGSYPYFDALWRDLYAAGAEIVLNGHDHNYERFAPQNPDAQADTNGIREFVVGTGGAGLNSFNAPIANSLVRYSGYGVLRLTLHASSYDWAFVPVVGSSFGDAGSGACH
jgi:hypothetical protein